MTTVNPGMLAEFITEIVAPDPKWLRQARTRIDSLTKPLGSLGRLEDIAARFVAIRNGDHASPLTKAVYVFAADHGIVAEGVSAYPKEVTRQMVLNFLQEGAAINVLARLHHAELTVVDVGVDADFGNLPGVLQRKVRPGTRNMLHEPAMTEGETLRALRIGLELATSAQEKRQTLIAVGEMGIGNTTSASVITAVLTGQPPAAVTGKGTGLDAYARGRKIRIVDAIIQKHFGEVPRVSDARPLEVLQRVGGLEIAAMVGFVLGAARYQIPVVTDGFISTAAAALAYAIEPPVKEYLFAGHCSQEPGHRFLLEYLGLDPILTLDMRLGEGTGAVLAMPIIESALRLYTDMATFASAGVSGVQA
ncbi:MAG: nicotinate-nucleotide--dimethylbenzimidazole phosphoribosyltransferase [Candidatus Sulfotelmatobacter sp.]